MESEFTYRDGSPWGLSMGVLGHALRRPLPPTEAFPTAKIEDRVYPPYITTQPARGGHEVMICQRDGCRAGFDLDSWTCSNCVYADGENLPPEWVEPVAAFIAEARECFPGERLLLSRVEIVASYDNDRDTAAAL